MGEISETGLWHGIPVSSARIGYFRDALNTFHTMRNLRVQNRMITFSTQNDGAVTMDGSYLNWQFTCPLGAFTPAEFSGLTVAQFFDRIKAYTDANTVKAWEEFAAYISGYASTINSAFTLLSSATVSAPGMQSPVSIQSIPMLTTLSGFSELIVWIKSIIPASVQAMDSSVLRTEAAETYMFSVVLDFTTTVSGMDNASMSFTFVL